jgi:hypothetical protein
LIGKWLNAGVMEAGAVTHPEAGSPQGGVVSPVLANVYLHYVLDQWFAREVQPRLKGRAYVVRYADDFVIGFTEDEDARRVRDVLPKRFGKYGLTIHPDKTRLVPFRKPPGATRSFVRTLAMSLTPPPKVQELQEALHAKAKGSPGYRFYLLYDKVYRRDVLAFAHQCCLANGGAANEMNR